MTREIEREVTGMSGTSALPRSNGELVFESPWEAVLSASPSPSP